MSIRIGVERRVYPVRLVAQCAVLSRVKRATEIDSVQSSGTFQHRMVDVMLRGALLMLHAHE